MILPESWCVFWIECAYCMHTPNGNACVTCRELRDAGLPYVGHPDWNSPLRSELGIPEDE